jgi:hypothetical protein
MRGYLVHIMNSYMLSSQLKKNFNYYAIKIRINYAVDTKLMVPIVFFHVNAKFNPLQLLVKSFIVFFFRIFRVTWWFRVFGLMVSNPRKYHTNKFFLMKIRVRTRSNKIWMFLSFNFFFLIFLDIWFQIRIEHQILNKMNTLMAFTSHIYFYKITDQKPFPVGNRFLSVKRPKLENFLNFKQLFLI